MSKLLYIQASPRAERSHSRQVADAFVAAYAERHPDDEIVTRDIFRTELPAFDGLAVQAKYNIMHGQGVQPAEREIWQRIEAVIEEFKSADKYVLAVPMWNFGIPYRLKHYLDILIQPTYTFGFTDEGNYVGLVTGKPALIVYARGGDYSPGSGVEAMDYQQRYLELALNFIGISDIRSVVVQPTLHGGPEVAAAKRQEALAQALALLPDF
jgi:FMN-dependent NADH-azoreductase